MHPERLSFRSQFYRRGICFSLAEQRIPFDFAQGKLARATPALRNDNFR
jgi:hypothetical protein